MDPTTLVRGWATRFDDTFDEYVVTNVAVRIRPLTTSTGVTRFWFSDVGVSAATANAASERTAITLANTQTQQKSVVTMRYKVRDFTQVSYEGTSNSPPGSVNFFVYTDNTNWGAPVTATQLWMIEPEIIVEFRGIAST